MLSQLEGSGRKRKRNMPTFYPLDLGTPDNPEEVEKRKKLIAKRQEKINICLNCRKECKTGICEIFKH